MELNQGNLIVQCLGIAFCCLLALGWGCSREAQHEGVPVSLDILRAGSILGADSVIDTANRVPQCHK